MNDTEMTRKASETDCLQASFRTVRGVRAENLLASFTEPTTTAKHKVRATQSESDEVAKDTLHYTALELAEIKSEQVLVTDINKKATDTTAERTIVFVVNDNSEHRASIYTSNRLPLGTLLMPVALCPAKKITPVLPWYFCITF